MKLRNSHFGVLGAALTTLCLTLPVEMPAAHAAKKAMDKAAVAPALLEAWPGQRVVMLLPLQLGAGSNIEPAFGRAILPAAARGLREALLATGKFSIIEPYRFNPILLRGIQEGRPSRTEVMALVDTPTLETARVVMARLDPTFDQSPLIGQFAIEELRISGTGKQTRVQIQASGNLYEVSGGAATYSYVVTSDAFNSGSTTASIQSAAEDAFKRISIEFTKPLTEPIVTTTVAVVEPSGTPVKTPATNPVTPLPGPTDGVPEIIVTDETPAPKVDEIPAVPATAPATPGGARDIVPQLPAAQPPLDINVPNR